jgi:CARDB
VPRSAAVCGLLALLVAAPAGAKIRPDLVVPELSRVPGQVPAGGGFEATAKVKSLGAPAKGSQAAFYLSRDAKLGDDDLRLALARVRRLERSRWASPEKLLRVPIGASGHYRLLACADVAGKVEERREGNNCRASKDRLRVPAGSAIQIVPPVAAPQRQPPPPRQPPPAPRYELAQPVG